MAIYNHPTVSCVCCCCFIFRPGDYNGDYKENERKGPWLEYHNNGKLKSEGNYKNGKKGGPWISFWSNGQLEYKVDYKENKREGFWIYYRMNGIVFSEVGGTFKNGVKVLD